MDLGLLTRLKLYPTLPLYNSPYFTNNVLIKIFLVGLNRLRLLYENNYRRTLLDDENIVTNCRLEPEKLHHTHLKEIPASSIRIVEIDGQWHLVLA
jgi:hypothetical protein